MATGAKLNWTDFKTICIARNLAMQWTQVKKVYWIMALDGNYKFECIIRKDDPAEDDDQIDFETNYKDIPAKPVEVVKPFADAIGFRARLKGITGTATKNTTSNIDYKLTEERWINGVQVILKNHEFSDTVKFQIVDVDNILGYGAGTVLDEFASTWNICSDKQDQGVYLLSYPAKIVANLYIRLVYISTGTVNDVMVKANLFLHMKT